MDNGVEKINEPSVVFNVDYNSFNINGVTVTYTLEDNTVVLKVDEYFSYPLVTTDYQYEMLNKLTAAGQSLLTQAGLNFINEIEEDRKRKQGNNDE